MPKLSADHSKVVEAAEEFTPLEPGMYRVVLESVEVKQSKKDGSDYWSCRFYAPKPGQKDKKLPGGTLFQSLSMKEGAAFMVKQFFFAMGFSLDSDTNEMEGEECVAHVINEEYNNRMLAKISSLLPLSADLEGDLINP